MALNGSSERHPRASKRAILFGVVTIVASLGGCNVIVDTDKQCSADSDCKHFGYEFVCQESVCKGAAVPCFDATGMAGHGCYQSKVLGCYDAASGPTVLQTLNSCTSAECIEPAPLASTPATPPPLPAAPSVAPPEFQIGTTTTSCRIFGKPVVLVAGTPTGATLMSELSAAVNPAFLVAYVPMKSCDALAAAAQRRPMSGFAWYWDPIFTATLPSARRLCKLDDNTVPTMVVSDVAPSSCDPGLAGALSGGWQEALGPVSYVAVAVPEASPVNAISQEVATSIFGFGADPGLGVTVAPFTSPSAIVTDSSVGWLIPSLAGKPVGYGTWKTDSAAVAAEVVAADPQQAIGVMNADVVARSALRPIAYRTATQGCAVLPDSVRTKNDRVNVRDGHYPLWFNSRVFSQLTNGAVDPNAQTLLDVMAGKALTGDLAANRPTWDVFTHYADRHMVPTCAMKVRKQGDADFGALVPYQPPLACGCHFDGALGNSPSCLTCKSDAECPGGSACAPWGAPKSTRYCETRVP
jgi:hypothetical protein